MILLQTRLNLGIWIWTKCQPNLTELIGVDV